MLIDYNPIIHFEGCLSSKVVVGSRAGAEHHKIGLAYNRSVAVQQFKPPTCVFDLRNGNIRPQVDAARPMQEFEVSGYGLRCNAGEYAVAFSSTITSRSIFLSEEAPSPG